MAFTNPTSFSRIAEITKIGRGTLLFAALGALACSESTNSTPTSSTSLVSVAPTGGATGVATNTSITMRFSGAMMMGTDTSITLHQGSGTGAVVPCTKTWTADSKTLTMTPMSPLGAGSHYTIMLGSGMMDAMNQPIDMTTHGTGMGGQCMSGGMMGNTCSNGMTFGFTTGAVAATQLVSVNPAGGATGVGTNASITMQFSGAMMTGADSNITLHSGSATGTVIPCSRTWSVDSTSFTMTPMSPLAPGTHYTIMLRSDMMDAGGHSIDMTSNGMGMGGQCMGGMMGSGCANGMEFGFTTS